jgi:hypothetical protein
MASVTLFRTVQSSLRFVTPTGDLSRPNPAIAESFLETVGTKVTNTGAARNSTSNIIVAGMTKDHEGWYEPFTANLTTHGV